MTRMLVCIIVIVIVSFQSQAQEKFVIGADKLNFNQVWHHFGTDSVDQYTEVDWDAVEEIGLNEGNMVVGVHDSAGIAIYDPLLPASLPSGFSLYIWSPYRIEGSKILGTPKHMGLPVALEWHPEYDEHYGTTDLDGNPRKGGLSSQAGADPYADVPNSPNNCWYVDEGQDSAGIVLTTPLKMPLEMGECVNDCDSTPDHAVQYISHCVITMKADVSMVPDSTVVFTHIIYGENGDAWDSLQVTKEMLDGHEGFFDLDISPINIPWYDGYTQVRWYDKGKLYFDKVMYMAQDDYEMLTGQRDSAIDASIAFMETANNSVSVSGLLIYDEAAPRAYHSLEYLSSCIQNNQGYNAMWYAWPGRMKGAVPDNYSAYMVETCEKPYFNVNPFPFFTWQKSADDNSPNPFQHNFQNNYVDILERVQRANVNGNYGKDMYVTMQVYRVEDPIGIPGGLRYPSNHEVLLQVNSALCYGAKGIWYWPFRGAVQDWGTLGTYDSTTERAWDGILDRFGNVTDSSVYNEIIKINDKLSGDMGDALITMDWQDGFSRHEESTLDAFNLDIGGSIVDVSAIDTIAVAVDPTDSCYVEIGHLADASSDYLFVVNRRATRVVDKVSARQIEISFSNQSDMTLEEYPTGQIQVIDSAGTFSRWYSPAEGKLLKISEGTWSSERSINDTVIVLSASTLTVDNDITLGSSCHFLVENGATVTLTENGQLTLDGAVVECEGTGRIVVDDPNSISGTGTLVGANIEIATELVIPSGSDITFFGGGTIKCQTSYEANDLVVNGELTFSGSGSYYDFDQYWSVDDINVGSNGILTFSGNIFVNCLTGINVWDSGSLLIEGVDDNNRCHLYFRQNAEINCSSEFDCRYAILGACAYDEWDGILIVGTGSSIYMTNTWISDIYCDPVYQGTGVHLYQSNNSDNYIGNSKIMRYGYPDKLGDAVYLQPEQGTGSFLAIQCLETDSSWYTGLTSVSSTCKALGLQSKYNLRGVGAHSIDNVLSLDECLLTQNVYEGLYAEADSAQRNTVIFGDNLYDAYGHNTITENGEVQISLDGPVKLWGGIQSYNRDNDIGHLSPSVYRVRVDGGAWAKVAFNYWETPSPTPSMFDIIWGTCDWDVGTLSQSAVPSELSCFSLEKASSNILAQGLTNASITGYARLGRMNEVYGFIATNWANASTASEKRRVLGDLLTAEVAHIREYPDSIPISKARFAAFLNSNASAMKSMPEMIVAVKAEYYTWTNMPDSADVEFATIENAYKGTYAYTSTLEAKLFNAFNKRDSASIDNTIAEMVLAGCDSSDIRRARSERRAYYRCRKNRMLPKKRDYFDEREAVAEDMVLHVAPNPANTKATITCMIPEESYVEVKLRTIDGRELKTLYAGYRAKGMLVLQEQIQDLKPGAYVYSIESRYYRGYAKMLVVR